MITETLEYLGIAFVSSVLLIIMSKIILQALIRRPADYYSAGELMQEELMLNAGGISITKEHETNPEGENIEESHLEPQLGDFEAAEPEEIITEIPEGVHESVEVDNSDCGEVELIIDDLSEIEPQPEEAYRITVEGVYAADDDTETATSEYVDAADPFEENDIEVKSENGLQDIEDDNNSISDAAGTFDETQYEELNTEDLTEDDSEIESDQEISEDKLDGTTGNSEIINTEIGENENEDVTDRRTDDSPIGFKIRAKTSREPEPKKESEEESASVTEINEDGEKARGWTESYADIRKSLEKAFDEHQKPSMRLKKQVLIDIAVARGIEIPDGATKREILDMINALDD